MSKSKIFLSLVLLILTALACNMTLPQSEPVTTPDRILPTLIQTADVNLPQTEDAVPRISVEDAKAALDSGEAIIVDVRSADSYAQGHIAGAINIPLANIESHPAGVELNKNQWIITYCT